MSYPTMELSPCQSKEENRDPCVSSASVCDSENYNHGHHNPAATHLWAGHPSDLSQPAAISCPHQYHPESGMLDLHCSTYSPMPGVPDTGHYGSVSAPWITNEPIPCAMMLGELHTSVAIICPPELMDNQQFQDGQTEIVTHLTQAQPEPNQWTNRGENGIEHLVSVWVVYNVNGSGQVVVNHCQPGAIHTLAPVPVHRDEGPTQGNEMSMLVASNQYHQTACPLYSETIVEIAGRQSKAPAVRTDGTACESKQKKPCNCTKSQCLKLYCDCFANGEMCRNCNCSNCCNNAEHEIKRFRAIQACLDRNPEAFRPKIASGKTGEVKGRHNKGCNCKRSGCLKNYCECYEANIMCTASCKCVGCGNYHDSTEGKTGLGDCHETFPYEKTRNDKRSLSVITPSVVEAVCGCLLAQANKAEREAHSAALAERIVMEEFGQCLTQIVKSMFKSSTH